MPEPVYVAGELRCRYTGPLLGTHPSGALSRFGITTGRSDLRAAKAYHGSRPESDAPAEHVIPKLPDVWIRLEQASANDEDAPYCEDLFDVELRNVWLSDVLRQGEVVSGVINADIVALLAHGVEVEEPAPSPVSPEEKSEAEKERADEEAERQANEKARAGHEATPGERSAGRQTAVVAAGQSREQDSQQEREGRRFRRVLGRTWSWLSGGRESPTLAGCASTTISMLWAFYVLLLVVEGLLGAGLTLAALGLRFILGLFAVAVISGICALVLGLARFRSFLGTPTGMFFKVFCVWLLVCALFGWALRPMMVGLVILVLIGWWLLPKSSRAG